MAVAKGTKSTEGVSRALYTGIGAVKVLAVNPKKKVMEEIYDRQMDEEPVYVSTTEIDGKKIPSVRITFVVRTDAEKNNGIDTITNHTYFLQKRYRQGSQSGKYQVIDKYGRTAWATKEDIQAKAIPMYSNGPASIDADYRPALVGEEELTMFIKTLLNIPNVQSYVNGQWIDNPRVSASDCEVRLDFIDKYFEGNFKELEEIISYQPDNLVKIAFGVRTTDDNRQFQTTNTQMVFRNGVTDFTKFDAFIQERKNAGAYPNTEFNSGPLCEYIMSATPIAPINADAANAVEADAEPLPW